MSQQVLSSGDTPAQCTWHLFHQEVEWRVPTLGGQLRLPRGFESDLWGPGGPGRLLLPLTFPKLHTKGSLLHSQLEHPHPRGNDSVWLAARLWGPQGRFDGNKQTDGGNQLIQKPWLCIMIFRWFAVCVGNKIDRYPAFINAPYVASSKTTTHTQNPGNQHTSKSTARSDRPFLQFFIPT